MRCTRRGAGGGQSIHLEGHALCDTGGQSGYVGTHRHKQTSKDTRHKQTTKDTEIILWTHEDIGDVIVVEEKKQLHLCVYV